MPRPDELLHRLHLSQTRDARAVGAVLAIFAKANFLDCLGPVPSNDSPLHDSFLAHSAPIWSGGIYEEITVGGALRFLSLSFIEAIAHRHNAPEAVAQRETLVAFTALLIS